MAIDAHTIAYVHVENGAVVDDCGNTWTQTGTLALSDSDGIYFDGSSYLSAAVSGLPTGSSARTVDCWIKRTSSAYSGYIISYGEMNNSKIFALKADSNSTLIGMAWDNDAPGVSVELDKFYHVAIIYNGTAIKLYIDGIQVASCLVSANTSSSKLFVGTRVDGNYSASGIYIKSICVSDVVRWEKNFDPETGEEISFRYENPGFRELTLCAGTDVEASAAQSATGIAYWGTAYPNTVPHFPIPPAMEVWVKVEIYIASDFARGDRLSISNYDSSHSYSGIWNGSGTSDYNRFLVDIKGSVANNTGINLSPGSRRTILLHMKSGSTGGVVEFWVDNASTYYSKSGNVNNGKSFDCILLYSNTQRILFSNIIISDERIGLGEDTAAASPFQWRQPILSSEPAWGSSGISLRASDGTSGMYTMFITDSTSSNFSMSANVAYDIRISEPVIVSSINMSLTAQANSAGKLYCSDNGNVWTECGEWDMRGTRYVQVPSTAAGGHIYWRIVPSSAITVWRLNIDAATGSAGIDILRSVAATDSGSADIERSVSATGSGSIGISVTIISQEAAMADAARSVASAGQHGQADILRSVLDSPVSESGAATVARVVLAHGSGAADILRETGEWGSQHGTADISLVSLAMEAAHADISRGVAASGAGRADVWNRTLAAGNGSADTERHLIASEAGGADVAVKGVIPDSGAADMDIDILHASSRGADISRNVPSVERGAVDMERKTPHMIDVDNGTMRVVTAAPAVRAARVASLRSVDVGQAADLHCLRAVSIRIAEQQLTDRLAYTVVGNPAALLDDVVGNWMNYGFSMRVESTSQEGIVQSCQCCADIDEILYTKINRKFACRTVQKTDSEGNPMFYDEAKTMPVYEEVYPKIAASEFVSQIASCIGKGAVQRYDDFISSMDSNVSGSTYADLIRELFGWTARIPTRIVNAYIRGGTLYVVQRGKEENEVDITGCSMTRPAVGRSLVRTLYGTESVTQKWKVLRAMGLKVYDWTSESQIWGRLERDEHGGTMEYDSQDLIKRKVVRGDLGSHSNVVVSETEYEYKENGGRKYLHVERETRYDEGYYDGDTDAKTVTETVHDPLMTGQKATAVFEDGEFSGSVVGRGLSDDTPSQYARKSEMRLVYSRDPVYTERTQEVDGEPIYDANFQVDSEDTGTLERLGDEMVWLNRRTEETLSFDLHNFPHIIDFNDRVLLDGNTYYLRSNTATRDARIANRQSLVLVRWY